METDGHLLLLSRNSLKNFNNKICVHAIWGGIAYARKHIYVYQKFVCPIQLWSWEQLNPHSAPTYSTLENSKFNQLMKLTLSSFDKHDHELQEEDTYVLVLLAICRVWASKVSLLSQWPGWPSWPSSSSRTSRASWSSWPPLWCDVTLQCSSPIVPYFYTFDRYQCLW